MKKQKIFCAAVSFLVLFVLWTITVRVIDVRAIGPNGTTVGFATINGFFHKSTGVHMQLYTVTDWLSLVPLCLVLGFAMVGMVQLIQRKSLFKVDRQILILGAFYLVVIVVYMAFEKFVVNYRPILIDGRLEASYPSSTTMLVLCVIPTAILQPHSRIKQKRYIVSTDCLLIAFAVFMVVGRMLSGVHWLTDIIGGVLLSAGLVMGYIWVSSLFNP